MMNDELRDRLARLCHLCSRIQLEASGAKVPREKLTDLLDEAEALCQRLRGKLRRESRHRVPSVNDRRSGNDRRRTERTRAVGLRAEGNTATLQAMVSPAGRRE